MSATGVRTAELSRSDEIDWRHALIDSGKFGPPKIAPREMRFRKNLLTRRLRTLHYMRAAVGPSR